MIDEDSDRLEIASNAMIAQQELTVIEQRSITLPSDLAESTQLKGNLLLEVNRPIQRQNIWLDKLLRDSRS